MSNSKIKIVQEVQLRLDKFLADAKIAPSRTRAAQWIDEGHVTVNGTPAKASTLIGLGDEIEVIPPPVREANLQAVSMPLDILFEDKHLLALNKPAGLVVHPGAGHGQLTLAHALLAHCGKLSVIGGTNRPGIVHRLDKGTSGVMVVAKNDEAHLHLSSQFKNHQARKIYWAIIYGRPKSLQGTFKSAIGRHPTHRKKFAVVAKGGKESVTHYTVLKQGGGLCLIEINLETGRTHQIRVHLSHAGNGIVGDPVYGNHASKMKNSSLKNDLEKIDHPLLHARSLHIIHPVTNKKLSFTAKPPADFTQIARRIS